MPEPFSPEDWMLLHGSPGPPEQRLCLRAGPLTMVFEPRLAFLRYVRLGECELLRGVYAAVRDRNWGTILPQIAEVWLEQDANSFQLRFECWHGDPNSTWSGNCRFRWRGEVIGEADGTITYSLDGTAETTFLTNRTGFCVLHPDSLAGEPCLVEHVDGSREEGVFPRAISPHQPFFEIRALTHEPLPGVRVEVRMEGDTFEMEDQRNWTDASFKTYCRPLGLPYPVEVQAGASVRQRVTVRLLGTPSPGSAAPKEEAPVEAAPVRFQPGDATPVRVPRLGVCLAADRTPLTAEELGRLSALRLSHVRVDLHLDDPDHMRSLDEALWAAGSLGIGLQVALFLPDDPPEALTRLAADSRFSHIADVTWLAFPEVGKTTTSREIDLARRHLQRGAIVGGTDAYFTELNRNRPPAEALDGVCYSINPQVHAFDNASLMETLRTQGTTVASARELYPELPVHVSSVTLRPRPNPDATGSEHHAGDPFSNYDPRQTSLFAAAWTLGSLKYLGEAGARSVTLFETHGPRGVLRMGPQTPLPHGLSHLTDSVFPMYHVLQALGEFREGELVPLTSSDPLRAVAAFLRDGARRVLLIANLTPEMVEVVPPLPDAAVPARLQRLDAATAPHLAADPEAFIQAGSDLEWSPGTPLRLVAYAVVRLEWPIEEESA